jgi:hypothetical protein
VASCEHQTETSGGIKSVISSTAEQQSVSQQGLYTTVLIIAVQFSSIVKNGVHKLRYLKYLNIWRHSFCSCMLLRLIHCNFILKAVTQKRMNATKAQIFIIVPTFNKFTIIMNSNARDINYAGS